jgi:antitoxin HicB
VTQLPETYVYPAVFTFEDDGVSVEFPDLDGCFTCGSDLEEAARMAEDALAGYLSISWRKKGAKFQSRALARSSS